MKKIIMTMACLLGGMTEPTTAIKISDIDDSIELIEDGVSLAKTLAPIVKKVAHKTKEIAHKLHDKILYRSHHSNVYASPYHFATYDQTMNEWRISKKR